VKDPDAKKAEWLLQRRITWSGFTGLTNRMIDSEAFKALRSVHSVKVLIYFWQKAEYAREKRKPGQESPIGNLSKILNQGKMSFEYRIAGYRGLRPDQFVIALRELYKYGFIDIKVHGRGVKGEYSKFSLSDRWKLYGTDRWTEIPFPIGERSGWASEAFKKKQQERREKHRYGKAELLTTESRSYSPPEKPNDYGIAELQTTVLTPPVTTESRSLLRSTKGCTTIPTGKKVEKKVRTLGHGSKSIAAAIRRPDATTKQWRPPLSEIRENVAEILRQRPDPRADDPRFVRFLADQLLDTRRGKFDPARVHRDLQGRHDLDDWTSDLLFAVTTINLQFRGATH